MSHLPEEGLPVELQELCINGCPLLTDLLEDDSGREWAKIAHVSKVEIDHVRRAGMDDGKVAYGSVKWRLGTQS